MYDYYVGGQTVLAGLGLLNANDVFYSSGYRLIHWSFSNIISIFRPIKMLLKKVNQSNYITFLVNNTWPLDVFSTVPSAEGSETCSTSRNPSDSRFGLPSFSDVIIIFCTHMP